MDWVVFHYQAGGSPAARHFLLLRQKKVTKEKATLLSASLRCATGNLRCSAKAGSRANSPAAQTSTRPDPLLLALLGADRRALGNGFGFRLNVSAPEVRTRKPRPGWACEMAGNRDQGRALSEPQASLRGPPISSHFTWLPEGPQTAGRLSFGYFSLAKQRKVTSRRAPPGLVVNGKQPKHTIVLYFK